MPSPLNARNRPTATTPSNVTPPPPPSPSLEAPEDDQESEEDDDDLSSFVESLEGGVEEVSVFPRYVCPPPGLARADSAANKTIAKQRSPQRRNTKPCLRGDHAAIHEAGCRLIGRSPRC
jgi:hypothetical protein